MGLRKLDDRERKSTRTLAGAMLDRGEHKDVVRAAVVNYLSKRGWTFPSARLRAKEVVDAQVAWAAPEEDT